MGNAALLMRKCGHQVLGSDNSVYPPMSDLLSSSGIKILNGYNEAHLENEPVDLIVIGNVVSRGNPEVEWTLKKRATPFISMPELIGSQILSNRKNIVISGTHGKTTTTTLTAFLLKHNRFDSGYLIGGVPNDFQDGANLGDKKCPFVIEGDEYDCAFFDKRAKFIHYKPNILVINNLDFDHVDIYRDLIDVQRSFKHLLNIVPSDGYVLVNGDDENLAELLPTPWTQIIKVGTGENNDLVIKEFEESSNESKFKLYWKANFWTAVNWKLPGIFNARNASMAALATGLAVSEDSPTKIDLSSLSYFSGVKKRLELLYSSDSLIVFEDFGHHPTAIEQTLNSLRTRYPDSIIHTAIEPRSNTSRTNVLQKDLLKSLSLSNFVYLGAIKGSKFSNKNNLLDVKHITEQLGSQNITTKNFSSNKELLDNLRLNLSESRNKKNIVCFFTNGTFDGIMSEFTNDLC